MAWTAMLRISQQLLVCLDDYFFFLSIGRGTIVKSVSVGFVAAVGFVALGYQVADLIVAISPNPHRGIARPGGNAALNRVPNFLDGFPGNRHESHGAYLQGLH